MSKIELDASGHRLYAQCVNDPLIHSIEITSGIVIQSIGESHAQSTVGRQTFTFSPCGSLLFKSNGATKIVCWNQLNDNVVNTLKLPVSGARAFISSLVYHPTKFLFACTVYGDTKGICMLLLNHDSSNQMEQPLQTIPDDNDDTCNEQIELPMPKTMPAARTFGTFGNILNRIDDLFALAIKNPNCTDDYKQRKQLEISLQRLRAPIQLLSSDVNGSEQRIDSTNSTETENNSERLLGNETKSADHSDSHSTQSNNTFTLEKAAKSDIEAIDENDDHTFNVENSDLNSNATFEIDNERSSSGRSNVDDVNTKEKKHESAAKNMTRQ